MMHTEYRVTAPAPANKAELLNEFFASDSRPSEPCIHPIECDPRENPYNVQYVRSGAVPAGEDAKTYDLGMFRCCTQGQGADNITMGELWVTYEVELRKPQLASQSGKVTWYRGTGTINTTAPFGTSLQVVMDDFDIDVQSSGGTGRIRFPRGLIGTFLVNVTWNPNGNMTIATVALAATGVEVLPVMGATGTDGAAMALPVSLTTGGSAVFVVATSGDVNQLVDLTATTLSNSNGAVVMVTQLPMGL